MKNEIQQQATDIARQLHMPASELLDVIALAGLEAIAATLAYRGKVTFPLSLATTGDLAPPLAGPLPTVPGMAQAVMIAQSLNSSTPTPWRGFHHNSKAYAEKMAEWLREICTDEEDAANWYRTIRNREIPPRRELAPA